MLAVNRDNAKQRFYQMKSAATKERWKDLAKQVQLSNLEDERCFMEGKLLNLNKLFNKVPQERLGKL